MKSFAVTNSRMLTYKTKLSSDNPQDLESLLEILVWHREVFNIAAEEQFGKKKNSIVDLHKSVYNKVRKSHPEIPSQIIIRGEQECLSSYRSVKSNKHKLKSPIKKKNLSMRLDKRLYSKLSGDTIRITTSTGRKEFKFEMYDKLQEMFLNYEVGDPEIFEKDGELFIAFPFKVEPAEKLKQKLVLGVDLGVRVAAATSDGRLIQDKKFNGRKRKLRFLKRTLQSKGTKSAKRKLKKLRKKERNINRNQVFLLAKEILKTDADTIALENLKGIKAKKHKFQNKNRISQVPLAELREVLTYKAAHRGMTVMLVNPAWTSQTDSITGKIEGERRGRRFYSTGGLVYDSDLNAARNIAIRAKLPFSYGNILDGQAVVNPPNVFKSTS
jgi:putative transposase